MLGSEISQKVKKKAIKGLKSGQTSGEDGYSADFQNKFSDILAHVYLSLRHDLLGNQTYMQH